MATIATHDLRSDAKDAHRAKTHNIKWARGARHAAGANGNGHVWSGPFPYTDCSEACHKRPQRDETRNYTHMRQVEVGKSIAQKNKMAKKAFRGTVSEAVEDARDDLSDSSGHMEIDEASAAPELNEIMYSYDAPKGPSQGRDILGYAITQAVQRFENNETEKIVKNEYDLVLDGKDEPESYVADADDDFEFIEGSHLN